MEQKSILSICSDETLANLLEIHLTDDGYQVLWCQNSYRVTDLIRDAQPDLIMLSLPVQHCRGNWRLLEELYFDPTIKAPVIAIVDIAACGSKQQEVLEHRVFSTLPLVFDLDQLLGSVHAAIGPAYQTESGVRRRRPVRRWPRVEQDDVVVTELTPAQVERLELHVGRDRLPSDTLSRIQRLTDERRRILLGTGFLTAERRELLATIDQELPRLWLARRQELTRIDPNLINLPPRIPQPTATLVDEVQPGTE